GTGRLELWLQISVRARGLAFQQPPEGCDLLHVQYPFFLAYAAIGEARALGLPVVCSFHVQPENILKNLHLPSRALSRLLYRFFVRFIYARADYVVTPSAFAAELLRKNGLERPITVVSNGVPQRFFDIERAPAGDKHLLLSVGRLASEKEQETLLQAVAQSRHRDRIEIVLAGVGPREESLKRLAKRLKLAARIGWVDDTTLNDLYGRADVFVHAGTIELEGMSVLEAMAAGNAVVVSDSAESACASLVTEPRARFRMGDAADLAARIDAWLDDPAARAAEGRKNRLFAQTLSHEKATRRLKNFYADVLGNREPDVLEVSLTGTS
ncbi:MAG: glycosyltransferase, partial [Pseudomonadota bacterium]